MSRNYKILNDSELATILHGLRCLQGVCGSDDDACDHFDDAPRLTDEKIDALAESLNLDSVAVLVDGSDLSPFTVIGFYEDTGETFAFHVQVPSAEEAIGKVAAEMAANVRDLSDIAIIGAVPGEVALTAPCEESGALAYACDLQAEDGTC